MPQEKAAARGRSRRTEPQDPPAERAADAAARSGTGVPIPYVTPQLRVYRLRLPGPGAVLRAPVQGVTQVAAAGRRVTGLLPSGERVAFFGGLGAAAVLGVLEWPVAAAIGIGTVIARRTMSLAPQGAPPDSDEKSGKDS